jgi:D-erythronate 2-dehydrogenase
MDHAYSGKEQDLGSRVLITGGAGFVGSKLARELLRRGEIAGSRIGELVLTDLREPSSHLTSDSRVHTLTGSLMDLCPNLVARKFDLVFHLAGAVSAECEADFDLGLRSNLHTTQALLASLRAAGNAPRVVYSSSMAVFGSDPSVPMPTTVRDETLPTPQSSYGIQKLIGEHLVTDYTRKGFIDGRSARLTTVVVRPGRPNGAASGFMSSIIREPLNGEPVICPVAPETQVAVGSTAGTIAGLIAVAEASREEFGGRTAINFPAITVSVNEMLDALEAVGGKAARDLVRFEPDAAVIRLVDSWPWAVEASRAERLGILSDKEFISIVRAYVADQAAG